MAVSALVVATTKLKFGDVATTLLSEDMRRKHQEPSSGDALTMTSTESRGRSHERGNNHNRRPSKSAKRSKSRARNREGQFCGKARKFKEKLLVIQITQEKVQNRETNTTYEKDDNDLVLATSSTSLKKI